MTGQEVTTLVPNRNECIYSGRTFQWGELLTIRSSNTRQKQRPKGGNVFSGRWVMVYSPKDREDIHIPANLFFLPANKTTLSIPTITGLTFVASFHIASISKSKKTKPP
jgi:hypothetical protein